MIYYFHNISTYCAFFYVFILGLSDFPFIRTCFEREVSVYIYISKWYVLTGVLFPLRHTCFESSTSLLSFIHPYHHHHHRLFVNFILKRKSLFWNWSLCSGHIKQMRFGSAGKLWFQPFHVTKNILARHFMVQRSLILQCVLFFFIYLFIFFFQNHYDR